MANGILASNVVKEVIVKDYDAETMTTWSVVDDTPNVSESNEYLSNPWLVQTYVEDINGLDTFGANGRLYVDTFTSREAALGHVNSRLRDYVL